MTEGAASETRVESTGPAGAWWILSPGLMRVVLAASVVLHHFSSLAVGSWAVMVFFVLSGYWVTLLYRRKYSRMRRPVLAFYTSRYLRLIPIYLLCQFAMLGLLYATHSPRMELVTPLWLLRMIPIVGSAAQPVLLGPSWTLDIEAQFYLAMPFLMLLLGRLKPADASRVALVVAVVTLPLLILFYGVEHPYLYTSLPVFLIGMAQAYTPWRPSRGVAMASLLTWVVLMVASFVVPGLNGTMLGGSHPNNPALFAYNASPCFVLTIVFLPYLFASLQVKSTPADRQLGNMAYPIYLLHLVVEDALLRPGISLSPLVARIVDVICVAIVSYVVEIWLDRPMERFREATLKRLFARHESLAA